MREKDLEIILNAYVDGEVSDEQREKVERLLETNEEARRIHRELKALCHCIQALPRQSLEEDLTAAVLRDAEREMLREAPTTSDVLAVDSRQETKSAWRRRILQPRNLAYPVVAILVALGVMLLQPSDSDELGGSDAVALHDGGEDTGTVDPPGVADAAPNHPREDRPRPAVPLGAAATNSGDGTRASAEITEKWEIRVTVPSAVKAITRLQTALDSLGNAFYASQPGPGDEELVFRCKLTADEWQTILAALEEQPNIFTLDAAAPETADRFVAESATADDQRVAEVTIVLHSPTSTASEREE